MSNDTETITDSLQEYHTGTHAKVSFVEGKPVAIVEATSTYIPIEEFKAIFNTIGKLVDSKKIAKLIFDKRKLTVFHQPSMEWYFTEWKEEMWHKGLKTHRKILPDNKVFQQSVKIGREKIREENPNLKFNEMDIQYKNSIQDAIDN
ncbi:hypothetical protein [Marivirga harenae]|uniref:hypothetical protein n=1 Tax=Marivirga harenae TaxID=2010992 RepID=UPI0026DF9EC2|nr:hypothetical protein [Marivirga harenae]WKV11684.1 hypothetical protein Q3Y49_15890 [Marivirga harenae]|tara:strand:+ start:189449 stop:189889 length:441 start_codon:yes stop_codon:yes gene_type:complete